MATVLKHNWQLNHLARVLFKCANRTVQTCRAAKCRIKQKVTMEKYCENIETISSEVTTKKNICAKKCFLLIGGDVLPC